jgi:hypothetical protein
MDAAKRVLIIGRCNPLRNLCGNRAENSDSVLDSMSLSVRIHAYQLHPIVVREPEHIVLN